MGNQHRAGYIARSSVRPEQTSSLSSKKSVTDWRWPSKICEIIIENDQVKALEILSRRMVQVLLKYLTSDGPDLNNRLRIFLKVLMLTIYKPILF